MEILFKIGFRRGESGKGGRINCHPKPFYSLALTRKSTVLEAEQKMVNKWEWQLFTNPESWRKKKKTTTGHRAGITAGDGGGIGRRSTNQS